MSLTKQQQLSIMSDIHRRLTSICNDRTVELTRLRHGKNIVAAVEGTPIPEFTNYTQAITAIREMDERIKGLERIIDNIRNPPKLPNQMTEEERFSQALGVAVAYKMDMAEIVAGVQ